MEDINTKYKRNINVESFNEKQCEISNLMVSIIYTYCVDQRLRYNKYCGVQRKAELHL